jgi:hypothetical protein
MGEAEKKNKVHNLIGVEARRKETIRKTKT